MGVFADAEKLVLGQSVYAYTFKTPMKLRHLIFVQNFSELTYS